MHGLYVRLLHVFLFLNISYPVKTRFNLLSSYLIMHVRFDVKINTVQQQQYAVFAFCMVLCILRRELCLFVSCTLSLNPHHSPGMLKKHFNNRISDSNRIYDLWNASPMHCQLSYAIRWVRVCSIVIFKSLKTFSDRKIYFNTSFRLPVCSLRQVK